MSPSRRNTGPPRRDHPQGPCEAVTGVTEEGTTMKQLGTGIGWRPEIADAVERMAGTGTGADGTDAGVDWVEVVAENVCPGHLPESLLRLRERGVTVVPHGVSLGL